MDDQLTISKADSAAIFAALRGIKRSLRKVSVKGRDDEATIYLIWNNIDLISLRLQKKSGLAESAKWN